MSKNLIFSKSYDNELGCYCYFINGIEVFSSEDLSEEEVRSNIEVLS